MVNPNQFGEVAENTLNAIRNQQGLYNGRAPVDRGYGTGRATSDFGQGTGRSLSGDATSDWAEAHFNMNALDR